MMKTATRPSPTRKTRQMCRLCHLPIVPSSQYYRTSNGMIRLGNCMCHEYTCDEHTRRWSIIEGTRPIRQRYNDDRTGFRRGKQNRHKRMDDSLIYCVNCRGRMIYRKEYNSIRGYIGLFKCMACSREQHND